MQETRKSPKVLLAVAVAAAAGALSLSTVPAYADSGSDEDKLKRGSCSGSTDWKWKVGPEDGGLEAEFEIDSSATGVAWRVKLFHDGSRYVNVTRRTNAEGEIELERRVSNNAGTDHFRAYAQNLRTGETCRARIWF